jgi:N-acetylglucosamine kinase-like BadF-type ATPase
MSVIVGVDAGGSSTTVAVGDHTASKILTRHVGPAAVVRPSTVHLAAETIVDCVHTALTTLGSAEPTIAVVGAAGAGRADQAAALREALSGILTFPVHGCPDWEIAYRAAFDDGLGVLLIAGTGAIAVARDSSGTYHRIGGYGPAFADEIGGYNMGRGALAAIAQSHDGRGAPTGLRDAVFALLEVEDFDDLVRWSQDADYGSIASLAAVVLDQAAGGDEVARLVVDAATAHLAAYVARAAELAGLEPATVALSGGLVHAASPLRPALSAAITHYVPGSRVVPDAVDPVTGALKIGLGYL